jgi:hypothetical protein
MVEDRVGKVLERVAREISDCLVVAESGGQLERDIIAEVLAQRIAPLLRAGQAMRDKGDWDMKAEDADWDAALATLEGRE